MERTLSEILWQLERKRKYCWSCGTNRTTKSVIGKAVTLVFFLCLSYLFLCAVLDFRTELDYSGENSLLLQANVGDHRSPVMRDHYEQEGLRNTSITNVLNMIQDIKEGRGILKPSQVAKIAIIFQKADMDKNKFVDQKELARWINERIKSHFIHALKDNFDKYFLIDNNPRNGLVMWEEYLEFFFRNHEIHGLNADDIKNMTPVFRALPQDVKVLIARIQASWSEAAGNDPEFLTVDEFLAFEHPEASPTRILDQVQDTFSTFDLDGDGDITQIELDMTYKEVEGLDRKYLNDKHIIDSDGNGQISRIELMRYMDPRNSYHSEKDAKALFKIADKDKDGRLSLQEVLTNAGSFIKSKFYNVEKDLQTQD